MSTRDIFFIQTPLEFGATCLAIHTSIFVGLTQGRPFNGLPAQPLAGEHWADDLGKAQIQKWLAATEQFDVPDGDYPVLCVLEMEPPVRDPQEIRSERTVSIKDGYDLNEAYEAAASVASQVGPGFDIRLEAAGVQPPMPVPLICGFLNKVSGTGACIPSA